MLRLLVHVEGETEVTFVNEMLGEHLRTAGFSVKARLAGNPRKQRGGIRPWSGVKLDVLQHLKEDRAAIHATMVDYYGLPRDWPGRTASRATGSASEKALHVESALHAEISAAMGPRFDMRRFVPLVMMHEFEALLFSDPDRFAQEIGKGNLSTKFRAIREEFESPEDIDDSAETAPSKRIKRLFPGYEKPLFGVLAAMGIGLATMRQECPHFNDWLNRLEALPEAFSSLA
ncbi:MAG: DUF4276 family protein [Terracidiphilus sp.]|jgi:hypothetical protein